MPQIPRYGQPRVERAPLPSVRLDPNAPTSAFGVPTELDVGGIQRVSAAIWEQEKQKADQIATIDIGSELSKAETEVLYGPAGHPELGALNQRGEKAMEVPDQVRQDWEKRVAEIMEKKAHNDAQRVNGHRLAEDYGGNIFAAVQRHVAGERKSIDDEKTKNFVLNEQDAAAANYLDPERVDASVSRQAAAVQDFAARNGLPADWIKQQIADNKSKTYLRVIELMSAGHLAGVKDYVEAHKQDLQGDDLVHALNIKKESTTRGEAQKAADDIIGKATDRVNAMELAKQITDPDVRDMAEQNIQQHYNIVKQAEAEQLNTLYVQATNILDKNPGANPRSVIPPAMWAKFTPEHRESLLRYAKRDVQNDDLKWLEFIDLRPQQLAALNQQQYYTKYRTRFDLQHQNVADAQWAAARDAVANGKYDTPQLTEFYSNHERLYNTLRNSGLLSDPNKTFAQMSNADAKVFNEFERLAEQRINEYETSTLGAKRKATPDEKQQILDQLVQQRVFIDRPWRSDPEKVAALVTRDEKQQAYVPIDNIPSGSQEALKNLFRSRGQKITIDKLQRAYAAQILDRRDVLTQLQDPNSDLNRILSGAPLITVTPAGVLPLSPIKQTQRRPSGAGREF